MNGPELVKRLRKEIGGADEGTIYGDVLALCDEYELLAAKGATAFRLLRESEDYGYLSS
ncbi:MAG: hypothetical protein KGL39_57840 [Patescibacteria group bacterium]|nr:hypothetical protein [Patescibacteria group bacterium]